MHQSETDRVICASCRTAFSEGVIGPEQAHDCAADAHPTGVSGNYGSAYDCDHYHWITRPDWVVDGVICDPCVARLLADGALAEGYRSEAELFGTDPDADADDDDAPVICASCSTPHTAVISHRNRQASGCAAEADDRGIMGHYGSYVCDMMRLDWVQRPDWAADGVICDRCVETLKRDGAVRRAPVSDAPGGEVFDLDALLSKVRCAAGEPDRGAGRG